MEQVKDYQWYGNIRELQNFIERICVFFQYHDNPDDINGLLNNLMMDNRPTSTSINNANESENVFSPEGQGEDIDLEQWEINNIVRALKENNLSIQKAANSLGISRTTLWRKMKKYNININ